MAKQTKDSTALAASNAIAALISGMTEHFIEHHCESDHDKKLVNDFATALKSVFSDALTEEWTGPEDYETASHGE